MGRFGFFFTNLQVLPPTVQVLDVTNMISWQDLPALGHDYLLRNKEIKSGIVKASLKEEF